MPGSKFNRRPVPRRRPAICIAPAGSCLPPTDRRRPEYIAGFAQWTDLDPVAPTSAAGIIRAGPRSGGGTYAGEITTSGARLLAFISDHWPTPLVDVTLYIFDPYRNPEVFAFPTASCPLEQPFDTGLLTKIYIPGYDLRVAHFTE